MNNGKKTRRCYKETRRCYKKTRRCYKVTRGCYKVIRRCFKAKNSSKLWFYTLLKLGTNLRLYQQSE